MEARERILNKAHELFNRYGIRSVTMDEIASQLGMSKKTIYQSFANKDELVDAVVTDHITTNENRCTIDIINAENAIHQIFLTMDTVQEMLRDLNPTIFNDLQKFHPASFAKLNHFKDLFLYEFIATNIETGKKEGLYREDLDTDILTKLRINTMFLPFDQDVFPYGRYNLVTVETEMIEHFLYGLSTSKAHKLIVKYKSERIKSK